MKKVRWIFNSDDFWILSFNIETLNAVVVVNVVGILFTLLIVTVLMHMVLTVLALCYYKHLHSWYRYLECRKYLPFSWYRHQKSKKYQPKDDPKKTTEIVVLSDIQRSITPPSDSEIVIPKNSPLPSSVSSVSNVYKWCMHSYFEHAYIILLLDM